MSLVRHNGEKILLPRRGLWEQWKLIHDHYAQADAIKWKRLAMLALQMNAGWPLDCIGNAFGHPKGHVSRSIALVQRELRERFAEASSLLDLADVDDFDDAMAA
jgi:hypothetical protein